MINLDSITNENNKEHNENWSYIPVHPYRIMIIGGSGSGKTNALLNLINEPNDIDKIYFYAKYLNKPKYEYLIKKFENAGIKHLNDLNALTECSNTMDGVFKNINDYNPRRKRKILKFRCRKLNISLVFITQSCFSVPKDVRLNLTHYLIMKINNKRELQNIAINHSTDIDYKDFVKIYRECTK